MNLILDVSAALTVVMQRPDADAYNLALAEATQVAAPDYFVPVLTHSVWKQLRVGDPPFEDPHVLIDQCVALVDEWVSGAEAWRAALDLAVEIGHPAYDCFYLALARERHAVLLTRDQRQKAAATRMGIEVIPA